MQYPSEGRSNQGRGGKLGRGEPGDWEAAGRRSGDAYLIACGLLSQTHVCRLHVRMLHMMGLVNVTMTRFCWLPRKPGRECFKC